jgi:hypothetical protein
MIQALTRLWLAPLCIACVCVAQSPATSKKPTPPKPAQKQTPNTPTETFLQWFARVTGLSATSGSFKGGDLNGTGDIWVGWMAKGGAGRLTFEGGWSWPVFAQGDQQIIAIRDSALWSIPVAGGDPIKLPHSLRGVKGLVGAGKDGVVAFNESSIGLFNPSTGAFDVFAPSAGEDQADIARSRSPRDIDLGDGRHGAESSKSHDETRVAYIRSQ